MTHEWGKTLKRFRLRTGLSQHEFSDAISDMAAELGEEDLAKLKENKIENIILSNSELSRYETGKRFPRYRSRFISLIWMLVKLGGIESAAEANDWLTQADQSPLTESEHKIIFKSAAVAQDAWLAKNLIPEAFSEEQPVGLTRPQFAMWSSLLAIVIILLGVIYLLVNDRNALQSAAIEPRAELQKVDSVESESIAVTTHDSDEEEENEQAAVADTVVQEESIEAEAEAEEDEQTDEVKSQEDGENEYAISLPDLAPASLVLGDFSNGSEGWTSYQAEEGMLDISTDSEALCSNLASAGGYLWAMRLWREEIPLNSNSRYKISMDVRSSAERNLTILLAHTDLFKWYLFSVHELDIGTQTIELEFDQHVADPVANLSFLLGGQAPGELCFDNIVIEEIGRFEVDELSDSQTNPNNMLLMEPLQQGWLETWALHPFQEPVYTIHFKNRSVCFDMKKNTAHLGQINLRQEPLALVSGQEYQVEFEIEASTADETQLNLKLGESVDEIWSLEAGPQTITHSFTSGADEPEATFLIHLSGPENSDICFKNILLAPQG